MKRSEAIKLIQNIFEFQGLGMQMRLKDAYAILDALERIGMLPPFNEKAYYKTWRTGGDGHKWEPEDETK